MCEATIFRGCYARALLPYIFNFKQGNFFNLFQKGQRDRNQRYPSSTQPMNG
jgi:hypothetical protein